MIENLVIRMVPWGAVEPVGVILRDQCDIGRCFQKGVLWKGVLMGHLGGSLMKTALKACFWLGSFCLWADFKM